MHRILTLLQIVRTIPQRGLNKSCQDLLSLLLRSATMPTSPRHLQIEVTTYCNLKCIMCPRTVALEEAKTEEERAIWQRHLPFDRFQSLIEEFPDLQSISLHGIGEPLMHPHLFDMIALASTRSIRVRFTTNATLLTPQRSGHLLSSALDRLIISLDGATAFTFEKVRVHADFEKVVDNIATLVRLRKQLDKKQPWIDVAMVVNQVNFTEVVAIIDLAAKLEVDGVVLSPLAPSAPSTQSLVCENTEWNRVTQQAEQRAQQVGIKLYVRGSREPIASCSNGAPQKRTDRCLYPWTSTVVTIDGEVMPCCNIHHDRYTMGNAFEAPVEDVWNGSRYQAFRLELKQQSHQPEPCRSCPEF